MIRKKRYLAVVVVILLSFCLSGISFAENNPMQSGVAIEVDKVEANVGDIIKVTIKVQNIENFAGYQFNLKYNPTALKPVDPRTGKDYGKSTNPLEGSLLSNPEYSPAAFASHQLDKGILNFGKAYLATEQYKNSNIPETSGSVAVIGFKVLKTKPASIRFTETSLLAGAANGIYLFNWSSERIMEAFKVYNSPLINKNTFIKSMIENNVR